MGVRLVGIDPGKTTGYVDVMAHDNGLHVELAREITWENRFTLKELLARTPSGAAVLPDAVVVESFQLYAHKAIQQIGNDFPSVRVIGTVEAYLEELGILGRLFFQPAGLRKSVKVLSEHKLVLGSSPHVLDAYQHVRYYHIVRLNRKGGSNV